MASTLPIADQLRTRIRQERRRLQLSQNDLAEVLHAYPSTVAKIEAGVRAVQVDELSALADIFGISVDALLGRSPTGADLLWALSKITSVAHKSVTEVSRLAQRISGELQDVRQYVQGSSSADELIDSAEQALESLNNSVRALSQLANEFPLKGHSQA